MQPQPQPGSQPATAALVSASVKRCPEILPRDISKVCLAWRKEVALSIDSLLECHRHRNTPVGGPPDDDRQLSLILSRNAASPLAIAKSASGAGQSSLTVRGKGGKKRKADADAETESQNEEYRILLVYWLPLQKMVGKPISLDDKGCVIHIPNFVTSREDFSKAEVIHPAIGARMKKARDEREKVSESVLRLKSMCETFLEPFTGFEDCDTHCFVCGKDLLDASDVHNHDADSGGMRCPFCLLCTHSECSAELATKLTGLELSKQKKLLMASKEFDLGMLPSFMSSPSSPSVQSGAQSF